MVNLTLDSILLHPWVELLREALVNLIIQLSGRSTTEALARIKKPRPLRLRCEQKLEALDQASLVVQVLSMVSLNLVLVTINLSHSLHTTELHGSHSETLRIRLFTKSSTILPGKFPKKNCFQCNRCKLCLLTFMKLTLTIKINIFPVH